MLDVLLQLGLDRKSASKAIRRWTEFGAAERIRENPYCLLPLKVDLAVADRIARKLNIADDDPRRIDAVAWEVMQREQLDGHCYIIKHTLAYEVSKLTGLPQTAVEGALQKSAAFVFVDERRIMPVALAEAEQWVCKRIEGFKRPPANTIGIEHNVYEIDDSAGIALDEEQLSACDLVLSARIGVITGPPGAGKTSCLNEALRQFNGSLALCAPTGKAALRMQAVMGRTASTIHRLLAWKHGVFTMDENSPFYEELVIVDESSMLDIQLASALLRAVDPDRTRIIFVGDADQLPPVGPGAFFRDLIASGCVPVVRLRTNHRAAEHSWVYRNAPRILEGKGVELDDGSDFEWYQVDRTEAWGIKDVVRDLVKKLRDEGVPADELQVLSPMKVREAGCNQLNKELQAALNPTGREFTVGSGDYAVTIREGDRVMQTRNNYELNVFNGEVGEVETVAKVGVKIRYDQQYRTYINPADRQDLALAYACTVHKFQGSEVKDVIVVCHSSQSFMLTRQLLYTAVTRARRRVFLVGDEAGVKSALRTVHDAKRRTLLKERLRGEIRVVEA